MPPSPLRAIAIAATSLAAVLSAGCQSVFFSAINRGAEQPDATVAYAPARGLSLDVYRPAASSTAGAPVVVFFYGGSWQTGARAHYRFVGSRLAANGIVAIVADYRLGSDPGFPGFVQDAADAVSWSHAHARDYGGDPGRLFVAGHSAGAQLAALLGTDARYLEKVGLKPRDLAGVIGLSGPYDFEISGDLVPIFGPPAQWKDAMAIHFVDGDEPPFLLIHGTGDRTVWAERNSGRLDAALRKAGDRSTLVLLPDAGHLATVAGLYDPKRAPAVLPAILAFTGVAPVPAAAPAL